MQLSEWHYKILTHLEEIYNYFKPETDEPKVFETKYLKVIKVKNKMFIFG